MVQNSLTNQPEMKVSYDSNGETVNLSPSIVRRYLTTSNNVTDQEVMMFISLCKFQHLNPFLREAYLIKYGNSPATMVTGKDVFIKRARKQKDFAGMQAGVIVWKDDTVTEREGTFVDKEEELIGGWAKVYVKGFTVPFYASVSLEEYMGRKQDGSPNGQWSSKPATMIRKVALSQALREAYPMETAGLYEPEEMGVDETPEAEVNAIGKVVSSTEHEPEPVAPPDPVVAKTVLLNNEPEQVAEPEPPVAPNVPIEEPLVSPSVADLLFGGFEV